MARNWGELASNIVELVGGKDNIASYTHCITRLRFRLKDEQKADDEKIGQLEGVIQVMHAQGQYQVVIGTHVTDVYDEVVKILPDLAGGEVEQDDAKGGNIVGKLLDIITGIFTPFLPAFSAAGLLKALAVMCSSFGWLDTASSTYVILNCIGDGLFQFLPIILGYTAGKKFGCNQWITMAVAAFLVHPNMVALGTTFPDGADFFGIPVTLPASGYLQSVIPIILAAYLQSWIEKPLKKLPDTIRGLFGGMLDLFLTGIITLFVIGPVSNVISNAIASGLIWLLSTVPALAGLLIAGLWPVLIIFGMHWAFIPVIINNIATLGYDIILPITVGTNYAVGAVCLAIFLKTKNATVKETSLECLASAWLGGITEPAIYGLLLKYKKPFAVMAVSCGVCGAFAAGFGMHQAALITTSVITLPAVYAMCGLPEIIALLIACVISFAGTITVGYSDKMLLESE